MLHTAMRRRMPRACSPNRVRSETVECTMGPMNARASLMIVAGCLASAVWSGLHVSAAQSPPPMNWTTAEDHQNMMAQLGIRRLRPAPSGNESAPNHANYDEAIANPFPDYPDVLTLKDGRKVTSADMWWKLRRPEIVEDFEREVLGRVPASIPKVTWTVTKTVEDKVGPYPVIAKELTGQIDNSAFPGISVDIQMVVVTPAW